MIIYNHNKHAEIRLEQSIYIVSEDVPTRHLALLVCVEGINLEDQAYNIRIRTEDLSDACAATGMALILMCSYQYYNRR